MKKLAVLIPTYNAAPYLKESIDSILNQTFTDFDLFIYDDCSTDDSEQIILKYNDNRVFYTKNCVNIGIAKTLNKGLNELLPRYKYIARMDADDWAFPERFQKQINYLEENQDVTLCGTQGYWLRDTNQNPSVGWTYPIDTEYIKYYLLFAASFGHSSVIYRSDSFQKQKYRYNETITTCEDWDLWINLVKKGKVANLPIFLMKYRILENSNHRSPQKIKIHLEEKSKIISEYWAHFDVALNPHEVYEYYYEHKVIPKLEFVKKFKILIKIFNQLHKTSTLNLDFKDNKEFAYLLTRKMLDYWKRAQVSRFDISIWILIVKEVKFINKIKLLRSQIR